MKSKKPFKFSHLYKILNSIIIIGAMLCAGLLFAILLIDMGSKEIFSRLYDALKYIIHRGDPGTDMHDAGFIIWCVLNFIIILVLANLALLTIHGLWRLLKVTGMVSRYKDGFKALRSMIRR